FALRAELTATERTRQEALTAAEAARAAVQASEQRVLGASAALEAAQVEGRHATEHHAALERRRQRAEREVHDADALTDRLSTRRNDLVDQLARLDDESRTLSDSLSVRGEA